MNIRNSIIPKETKQLLKMNGNVSMEKISIPVGVSIRRIIINYFYSAPIKILSGLEISLSNNKTERIVCGDFNNTEQQQFTLNERINGFSCTH